MPAVVADSAAKILRVVPSPTPRLVTPSAASFVLSLRKSRRFFLCEFECEFDMSAAPLLCVHEVFRRNGSEIERADRALAQIRCGLRGRDEQRLQGLRHSALEKFLVDQLDQ